MWVGGYHVTVIFHILVHPKTLILDRLELPNKRPENLASLFSDALAILIFFVAVVGDKFRLTNKSTCQVDYLVEGDKTCHPRLQPLS